MTQIKAYLYRVLCGGGGTPILIKALVYITRSILPTNASPFGINSKKFTMPNTIITRTTFFTN